MTDDVDTNDLVRVPFGDNGGDKAVLLLAAAESLGLTADVVATSTHGVDFAYVAPRAVVEKALEGDDLDSSEDHVEPDPLAPAGRQSADTPLARAEADALNPDQPSDPEASKAPAKKAPAKKAAAKRAPAKKTAAKKTTAKSTTKKAV